MEGCFESRKRVRDDSDDSLSDVLGSKILRVDAIDFNFITPDVNDIPVESVNSDANSIGSERIEIHADNSVLDSFQANAIQEDLLKILDEADTSIDRDSEIQDLDSLIRSFEEEIHVPTPVEPAIDQVVSESGESQPELGYLLEASDDELGIPPSEKGEMEGVDLGAHYSICNGMRGFLGLEDEVASYCWFDSLRCEDECEEKEEVVALGDGLFDHSDVTVEFPSHVDPRPCSVL